MTKDKHPDIQAALENAVEKLDMDGVLHRLTQIAVSKRNAASEAKTNRAEQAYWQKMVELLVDWTIAAGEVEG